MVAAAISQYIPHMRAVSAKKRHLSGILMQLAIPCHNPLNTDHTFLQKTLLSRRRHNATPAATQAATAHATIHQRLKSALSDKGSHIFSTKNSPNMSHLSTNSTTSRISMETRSQALSNTTVPKTFSYEAFLPAELRLTTPQRTNSPIRGITKFAR
jgi:hypothetical protein